MISHDFVFIRYYQVYIIRHTIIIWGIINKIYLISLKHSEFGLICAYCMCLLIIHTSSLCSLFYLSLPLFPGPHTLTCSATDIIALFFFFKEVFWLHQKLMPKTYSWLCQAIAPGGTQRTVLVEDDSRLPTCNTWANPVDFSLHPAYFH